MELIYKTTSGIHFTNTIEESDSLNILNYEYLYNGGGVAVGDFNNDGREDLYFTGNLVDNALFLNQGNLNFKDVTLKSNVACKGLWSMGATVIDINQDGWLDIYVSVTGKGEELSRSNQLLINKGVNENGIPQFEEQAKVYGLDYSGFSINSYFFDFDKDGDLDLYILNNQFTNRGDVLSKRKLGKHKIKANINRLFRNEGENTFVDVTETAGVLNDGFSLSAIILDVNNDGWDDIFVSNDFVTSSALYVNQKNGTFKENISQFFQHQSFSSMGVDVADFDNNLEEDLISLDMLPRTSIRTKQMFSKANFLFYDLLDHYKEEPQYMRNCLYTAENNRYHEISQLVGIHNTDWSWSPLFVDLDNDGKKDLTITNGFPRDLTDLDFINYRDSYSSIMATQKEYLAKIPRVKISNVIFKNKGKYQFEDITAVWGVNRPSYSSGQATADLDSDGDLELIVNNINEQAYLYRNHTDLQKAKNYVDFNLKGPKGNLNALHVSVTLFYDEKKQTLKQNPYRGYLSSLSQKLHFGLGASKMIDSVEIDWRNDHKTTLYDLKTNQVHLIDYARVIKKTYRDELEKSLTFLNMKDEELGINFMHIENKSYDFFQNELQQRVFTNEGPAMATGDINGDGLEDLIIGGAKDQPTYLFSQNIRGNFNKDSLGVVSVNKEVTALALFDVDNDNDLDLYMGFGHNGSGKATDYQDKLLLNDGRGIFTLEKQFPLISVATAKAIPFDFDQDGDVDLFVAARLIPGQYPLVPKSYYLENHDGKLIDRSVELLPKEGKLGRIATVHLVLENDLPSLYFTGNWTGIHRLQFNGGYFQLKESVTGEKHNGLWNTIELADLDEDGDLDIIAGNYGLNTPYTATATQPFVMLYGEINASNQTDQVIFNFENGNYYPIHLRGNFMRQFQSKKRDFNTFSAYAQATIDNLFTPEEKKKLNELNVHMFETVVFENIGDGYKVHSFPIEVQQSPIFATKLLTIKKKKYILLVGNDNMHEVFTGPKNAFNGALIEVNKNFNFKRINVEKTGLDVPGAAKQISTLKANNDTLLLISQNNDKLLVYGFDKAIDL